MYIGQRYKHHTERRMEDPGEGEGEEGDHTTPISVLWVAHMSRAIK